MFDLPEDRMIQPDDVLTRHEKGTVEDCEEIDYMYHCIAELVDACDESILHDKFLKETLNAHRNMIENRSDWDMCQKTVRRRRIIAMWHNTQILKKQSEDKTQ